MQYVNIIETNLVPFGVLSLRPYTDLIVIHHTGSEDKYGNPIDQDVDAYTIDQWHKSQGWTMIGYNYVIRKSGSIERGRPEAYIGSHCYQFNSRSIGIHLSGNFFAVHPTNEQIESTAMLIANICYNYNIPIDRQHILGHRELNSTGCPGDNLYNILDIIVGKANWYANN